jgi:two-component system, OmpR family, sensor histidine kinase CreC
VRISYRIFLGFAVILAAGFYFLISWTFSDVSIQPKKALEEPMVDIAHVLAAFLEREINDQQISTAALRDVLDRVGARKFRARIYELEKSDVNLGVYVTDQDGMVIFDSNNNKSLGRDFSTWNDVRFTLEGKYGSRTTREEPDDPLSSVAYVAAPIYYKSKIFGVCTVSKPWKSINAFIDTTQRQLVTMGVIGFLAAMALSFFIARWITRPIRQLTYYADGIKEGDCPATPRLAGGEIKELGESFEKMRESLEGKRYIEKYVQTLTHQLKGPISAIKGAAELLQEELPEQDRNRFVSNIEVESNRLQRIVERMLELASLEHRRELRNVEKVDLAALVNEIVEEMTVGLEKKEIVLVLNVGKGQRLKGERFLLYQAVYNLLQNAVEFTPPGGLISVEIKEHWNRLFLIIADSGAGIPAYALDKVFDKFYSLQRPDTGKKSSGLGLSLVKEVAELHRGDITIKKNSPEGTKAILRLPMGF